MDCRRRELFVAERACIRGKRLGGTVHALLCRDVGRLDDRTPALRVVADEGAVTTRSKLAELPAAMDGRVHVTGEDELHVQPVPLAETNVVPAGIVSETLTNVAATVAELFVAAIV